MTPSPCRGVAASAVSALILAFLVGAPPASGAGEIEGVRFAERFETGDEALALRGAGLLRYRILIKAYVAALYLPEAVPSARVLEDVPKRLEIEYFWDLDGADIADAGEELVRRSVDAATWRALGDRMAEIREFYEDIEAGDRYALTYLPGRGTELAKNGRTLGVVAGADFAAAYFGIWLGEDPLDASLRSQLLAAR